VNKVLIECIQQVAKGHFIFLEDLNEMWIDSPQSVTHSFGFPYESFNNQDNIIFELNLLGVKDILKKRLQRLLNLDVVCRNETVQLNYLTNDVPSLVYY